MSTSTDLERTESGWPLRKYTREQVELALNLLALNGGHVLRTVRQLRAEGIAVSEGIIYRGIGSCSACWR